MFPLLRQVWLGSRECLAPCSPRGAPRRSDPRESRARRVPASGGCQHQAPLALPCPRGALPGKDRFSGGRVPKLPARGRWETGGPVRSQASGEGSARRHPRNVLECLTPLREGADAAGGQVGGGGQEEELCPLASLATSPRPGWFGARLPCARWERLREATPGSRPSHSRARRKYCELSCLGLLRVLVREHLSSWKNTHALGSGSRVRLAAASCQATRVSLGLGVSRVLAPRRVILS